MESGTASALDPLRLLKDALDARTDEVKWLRDETRYLRGAADGIARSVSLMEQLSERIAKLEIEVKGRGCGGQDIANIGSDRVMAEMAELKKEIVGLRKDNDSSAQLGLKAVGEVKGELGALKGLSEEVAELRKAVAALIAASRAAEHAPTLGEWLGCDQPLTLIYSNYTGKGFEEFHDVCDGVAATLSICFGDGLVFGCYGAPAWPSRGPAQDSTVTSFMFTLSSPDGFPPTRFPLVRGRGALSSDPDCGPVFGGHDGCCDVIITSDGTAFVSFPRSYSDVRGCGARAFGPADEFPVRAIEVWRVPESAAIRRGSA